MKKLIALAVPIVLSLFLFGCAQSPAQPQLSACRDHRYFPLRLGAQWEYLWESAGSIPAAELYEVTELSVDQGTITERIITLAPDTPDIPEQNYENSFDCIDTGILGVIGSVGYLPHNLTQGLTWSLPFSEVPEQLQAADELATITVPAGTFEALCVTFNWTYSSYASPDGYYPISGESCYAEGVGLVYEEYSTIRPSDGDTTTVVLRLVSYTIPVQ